MTDRDRWLTWRREGVGGSDVAAILGLSPWASPWSVWADKSGLLPPEPENEYMAAGRWLESAIGPWFTHETGLHVAGEQTWCEHNVYRHHRCTVDGFAFEGPDDPIDMTIAGEVGRRYANALGLVEIKVTGPGRRWAEIPPHVQAQDQWQMHVTGLDHVWNPVLMGRRLDIHELERDPADIALMVERVDEFWHEHVMTGRPPPTDDHDATLRAIAAVHPGHVEGKALEADAALRAELRLLASSKAAKSAAARAEKRAKATIAAAMADAEELTVDGQRVLTYRKQGRTVRCRACGHESSSEFRVMRPTTRETSE